MSQPTKKTFFVKGMFRFFGQNINNQKNVSIKKPYRFITRWLKREIESSI